MSRRSPRGPLPPREPVRTGAYGDGRAGRGSSPWVIRGVVLVAAVIVVGALVYAAANGILFSLPSR